MVSRGINFMTAKTFKLNPFESLIKYCVDKQPELLENNAFQAQLQKPVASLVAYLLDYFENHSLWITSTLSEILAIPFVDLDSLDTTQIPLDIITESLLRQYPLLPLWRRNQSLYIGMANPCEPLAIEAIRFQTGLPTVMLLVEQPKLERLRKPLLSNPQLSLQSLTTTATETNSEDTVNNDIEDPPLIRYVNQLLQTAVYKKASDIHFEPHDKELSIRFRVDGLLHTQPAPPIALSQRILARIKIMAQLDIAERRLPQDGRFTIKLPDSSKAIDCRISTCPTINGEKIVVRLLDNQQTPLEIESLGLNKAQHQLFLKALQKSQGMILVTGPTGSGKTLTLYSALHYLNKESVNISSAEDPVEIHLAGINQINIHPKIGLDFAAALKMFLRQDPDIIMLGEIRDAKTAHISIQAAQTGHLVLSTVHTNSAAETLTRLINMEIPAYNIAASISLIIAQRLVRRLCEYCKQPVTLMPEQLAHHDIKISHPLMAFQAQGCQQCTDGYQGRIGIFELLPITEEISQAILQNYPATHLAKIAKEAGMITLQASAFEKVQTGITSLAELASLGLS